MGIKNFSWVIPNKLAGCALPGGEQISNKEYLFSDLKELYSCGIRSLFSLTNVPNNFGELSTQTGIEWYYYHINDFGIPDNINSYSSMIKNAITLIHSDKPLCVHCYAGIGRTGMVLASILGVYYSLSGSVAIQKIKMIRNSFDTQEQIEFVENFLNNYFV